MDVDAVRREAGPCPHCGAELAKAIFYGMPDYGTYQDLEDVVVFAGCLVPEEPFPYACDGCGSRYGPLRSRS